MKLFQKLLKWMPVILFILLIMVDRENSFQVGGFIFLLIIYTIILIARILYARDEWHREFDEKNLGSNSSIEKMSDLKDQLNSNDPN